MSHGAVGKVPGIAREHGVLVLEQYTDAPSQHPPYKDAGGRLSHCRVRIYLPDDVRDAPVVACSELPSNAGDSITNSAEVIAAGVIRANEPCSRLIPLWHTCNPQRVEEAWNGHRRPNVHCRIYAV